MRAVINWIKNNRAECYILLAIILVAAFFRFYRLPEYMTFLGDEGRDALVVKKILTQYDFPLLGAPTSVGRMYNGPLYYYMMAFSMAFFWMNPVAAAGMVAVLGILSVGLVYYLSREWFGKQAAIISALLYGISPVNIIYSRSSWNPNPAPFFALVGILGLYKAHQTKNYLWLILVGGALAFAVQMHLLALILIPIFGVIWLYDLRFWVKGKGDRGRNFWKGFVLAFLAFLFLMSPLVIFDIKYNFQNFNAAKEFFLGDRATTVNLNPLNTLGRILPIYTENLLNRYLAGEQFFLKVLLSLVILIPLGNFLFKLVQNRKFNWPFFTLGVWLLGGVMGLALYKQTIYDHYTSFLNPAIFILFGSIVHLINSINSKKINQYVRGGFLFLVLGLVIANLNISPLKALPNRQLQKSQDISKFVIEQSKGRPFNFALIASHNYDAAYQFHMDMYNHKPLPVPDNITDQLFVVCEDKICQPVGNPKYEIAAFGWTKVESEQEFQGVKVFKLVHNDEEKKESHR